MPPAPKPSPSLRALMILCAALTLTAAGLTGAAAQDPNGAVSIRPKAVKTSAETRRHRRAVSTQAAADFPVNVRGLTINRRPDSAPTDDLDDGENSAAVDGPTHYGNIEAFDPDPSVDSGLQHPYGFDGIGGYGSDLGFRAGNDTALYQRGP